jgi:hypothetical protein
MAAFRELSQATARWRPLDDDGLEHLTVSRESNAIVARSVVIGGRHGRPYGLRYVLACDLGWTVRSLDLDSTDGVRLHLARDDSGRWTTNEGRYLDVFDDCIDVDLSGTPFTNTLPIRRCGLKPQDGTVDFTMLYVPFDTFEPLVDHQRYTCLEPGRRFRYEAGDRSFTADLTVDEDGLVLGYPTLFKRATHPA